MRLEEPYIVPDAHGAKADVDVREANPEQAQPREQHVTAIQRRDAIVTRLTHRTLRNLIPAAAGQVAQRVAPERIGTQQDRVDDHDQGAEGDSEALSAALPEPQGPPGITQQDKDENDRQIQEVAVHVLKNQREAALSPVGLSRLPHGAGGRIGPEGLVVGAAVVVAGQAESARSPQDQHGRGERQEHRPPRGRRGGQQRRVKRREVIRAVVSAAGIVIALERGPRRVHDKRREAQEHQQRLAPPGILAPGLAETVLFQGYIEGTTRGGHGIVKDTFPPVGFSIWELAWISGAPAGGNRAASPGAGENSGNLQNLDTLADISLDSTQRNSRRPVAPES